MCRKMCRQVCSAHRRAGRQQHRGLAKGGAYAQRVHRRLYVLHGVVNGERLRLVAQLVRAFLRTNAHTQWVPSLRAKPGIVIVTATLARL